MPNESFHVGITSDFYTDAKGKFESILETKFSHIPNITVAPIPARPDNIALLEDIDQFDAIFALATKFTAQSVANAKRLALISRWGVGYDMIDVPALTEAGIALAITPGAVRRPVAEAILALLFALTTNLVIQDKLVRQGGWRGQLPSLGRNMKGRVLGSVGCGNIAGELFSMSRSLGFGRLIAHDPFITTAQAAALGVELVPLEEVFAQSDFVTINLPLSAPTKGLIGFELLRKMKPTAYLINTSRGPIVNEADLVFVLEQRMIAGAGLDVFEQEPLPASSKLHKLDNVILAPHALAWTEELARDNSMEACDNILMLHSGQVPASLVNREVTAQPQFQMKLEAFRRIL